LEIAKLTQELQVAKDEMHQLMERKSGGQDKLSAVGTIRKEKELKQTQGECEELKQEVARLSLENERLRQDMARFEDESAQHANLPRSLQNAQEEEKLHQVQDIITAEDYMPQEDPNQEEQNANDEENEGGKAEGKGVMNEEEMASLGSNTLRSSLGDFTKSQKLIIENVIILH